MTDPITRGRQLMRTLAQPDTEGMTAENARIATADWHGQVKASAFELMNLVEELVEARNSPAQARLNMAAMDVFIYGATADRLRHLEQCWDAVNDENDGPAPASSEADADLLDLSTAWPGVTPDMAAMVQAVNKVIAIEAASAWRRRFGLVILTAAEFEDLRLLARGIGRN